MLVSRERTQLKGPAHQARTGLLIDQRVVHGSAALDVGNVPAYVHGLMGRIAIRDGHRLMRRGNLRGNDTRHRQ